MELLTINEVANVMRLSRSKIYQFIRAGSLQSMMIDGSRRVSNRAIELFIAEREAENAEQWNQGGKHV